VLAGIVLLLNLISFAFGVAPRATLAAALAGTWATPYGVGQVLFKATPLVFTALAFQVAFRAGLFNIGTEGQLALGSLAAGWVGASIPAGWSAWLGVPVCIGAAMVAAAFVAFASLRGSAASLAFPLAVVAAFALRELLLRTNAGREMRWVGLNADACRAEGVDVHRRQLQAMLLSGALAGCASTATVLGYKGYFELGLGAGAGFSGIAVALLGGDHPIGLVLAAILFGTLQQAGLAINAHVPKESMDVLTACAIVLVAGAKRLEPRRKAAA
jgi:simple sugar transport system permease protein